MAERLLAQMAGGTLLSERKLPPERILAETFKVSRGVVREALNALQMAGIVERHVGDGTYLAESIDPLQLKAVSLRQTLDASANVIEAIEAREALDLAVTNLAIENAKADDLEVMDGILGRMRGAIDGGDVHRYLPLTLDLHAAIARAGGNSVLAGVVCYLIDLIRPNLWIIEQNYSPSIADESFGIHKAMVDAIRERSRRKAQAAVRKHYRKYPSLQKTSS
ncbi:MAG TPA: FCD domain-containing protein [Hyphomicrobiaceae bacterium]